MENNKNRLFYGYENKINSKFNDWFKSEGKAEYLRFRVRIFPKDMNRFREMVDGTDEFIVKNYTPAQRKARKERDRVGDFMFTQMDYDNSESKDVVMRHIVIVCRKNDEEKVKTMLNSRFDPIKYRKTTNNGMVSIATTLNYEEERPFIWVDAHDANTYVDAETDLNRYTKLMNSGIWFPICVLSYRRANRNGRTHLLLTKMKIHHLLFIEPQEEEAYNRWYSREYCNLVVCPENFSERKMGSTPVRNYILDYCKDNDYVWMLDDNIKDYIRLLGGKKRKIYSDVIFRSIEDYVSNVDNIGIASHNFSPCLAGGDFRQVISLNTKCYSSLLINTKANLRFRHKHQEDNFISIECLEKGFTTACFNHILYDKNTSGMDRGGNREGIYRCEGKDMDGKGYKERYEYFKDTLLSLHEEGKLTLKEGEDINKLLQRDRNMNSKAYHGRVRYSMLKGYDNALEFTLKKATWNGEYEPYNYEKLLTKQFI
jgi:hypothetical protein